MRREQFPSQSVLKNKELYVKHKLLCSDRFDKLTVELRSIVTSNAFLQSYTSGHSLAHPYFFFHNNGDPWQPVGAKKCSRVFERPITVFENI